MSPRPKYNPKPDNNHEIVLDFMKFACGGFEVAPKEVSKGTIAYLANYHGCRICATDMSKYGGTIVDWLVEAETGKGAWIEVKTEEAYNSKNHGMTPGEQWRATYSGLRVCCLWNDEQVRKVFDWLIERM